MKLEKHHPMDEVVAPMVEWARRAHGISVDDARDQPRPESLARKEPMTGSPQGYSDLGWSGPEMSNFDHTITPGLAELLQSRPVFCRHAAWNFNGHVWWQDGRFHEEVWQFHEPVAQFSADSLEGLMHIVNDAYGWD